jgi:prolyl oligopeptidase
MPARFGTGRYFAATLAVALLGASAGDDAQAPQRPVTDTYFGTALVDPYRYMESADPAYAAWTSVQLGATKTMLARARQVTGFVGAAPSAAAAAAGPLTSLSVVKGRAFYVKFDGARGQLLMRDLHGGSERVLLDASRYDAHAGHASLGSFAVSLDAKSIAIHVYVGNAAESDVHILRAADGADVETPLHGTVFDYVGFTPDGSRLLYSKGAHPVTSIATPDVSYDYIHVLGTGQNADRIVFGAGVSPRVHVPPRAFAFVDPTGGTQAVAEVRDVAAGGSRFYTAPLATLGKPGTPWRALGTAADAYTDYAVHGTTIDLATSAGAPNFKVVRASLAGPFKPHVVLPVSDTVVVSGTLDGIPKAGIFALNAAADADYVQLLDRGVTRMVRVPYGRDQKPVDVALPVRGSILQVATDPERPGALLELTSWTDPGDVYAFDPARGTAVATGIKKATHNARSGAEGLIANDAAQDPSANRVAEELSAKAADGTAIAVSVVHRPGIALDGSHPLMLRVAGAYGFSFTPDYRQVPEGWLAHGGIFAVAHVRGGGELGEAWHRAGMGARKSNSWTDLIAVAQRLIDAGYTSPKKLDLYGTIQSYLGGIASGIAIGRAIEERPDLFAAAVVDAPDFDMLRSERTALGRQSLSEFGSVATPAGFAALLAMSPYEHVRPGVAYPPILVRSLARFGLGDDWQAAKMVARLQSAEGRTDAANLDIPGDSPSDVRDRAALRDDVLAFLLYEDGPH